MFDRSAPHSVPLQSCVQMGQCLGRTGTCHSQSADFELSWRWSPGVTSTMVSWP